MRKNLNFKKLRTSNRLTQKEMADFLGVKQSFVSDIENGKSQLPYGKAKILAKKYGVDLEWLLDNDTADDFKELITGGVVVSNESIEKVDIQKNEVTPIPYENYMMVEYVDLAASAGALGQTNIDMLPESKKRLVPKEFERGNYLVIRVNGDSMVDGSYMSIPDGTEILVKEYVVEKGEKLPIRGNLFVISSSEGNVFKQIVEHNIEQGYIKCHSYNPSYGDYIIPLNEVYNVFIYKKIVSYRPAIPEIKN